MYEHLGNAWNAVLLIACIKTQIPKAQDNGPLRSSSQAKVFSRLGHFNTSRAHGTGMKRSREDALCGDEVRESTPEVRLIAVNEPKPTYDGTVFDIKHIQQLQNLYERFWIFDEIWPSIPLVDVCLCKISALLAEVRYFKQGWGPFGPETTSGKKLRQMKDDIELLRLILKNLRKFRPVLSIHHGENNDICSDLDKFD